MAETSGDTLDGGFGTDTIDGGFASSNGFFTADTVVYNRATPVQVDLRRTNPSQGAASGENDTIVRVENVTGGDGDDRLTGDDKNNILQGARGDDVLHGEKGRDVLHGPEGDDVSPDAGPVMAPTSRATACTRRARR